HFGVKDGDTVCINVEGARGGIYGNVAVRVNDASKLECHIDTEEANAMSLGAFSKITIVQ
ncbi:MAG: phosphate propanoyltransferase, partial [Clostridia bacterium]|nr:phosphate propanoyltransferase [Clostridia bacterium]